MLKSTSIQDQVDSFLSTTLLNCVHQIIPTWDRSPRISFHNDARLKMGFASSSIAMEMASFQKTPKSEIKKVASELASKLSASFNALLLSSDNPLARWVEKAVSTGGFLNFICSASYFDTILSVISSEKNVFGRHRGGIGGKLLIEHTSVNPNKPWHIGHMRNAVIGDTLGRMYKQLGYEVEIQNYIDDTGIQVAEALWQYLKEKEETTKRFDIFLGEQYVEGQKDIEAIKNGEEEGQIKLAKEIHQMGEELEDGKHRTIIEKCIKGQVEDAYRLGIYYDLLSWESDIIRAGIFKEAMALMNASPYVSKHESGEKEGCIVLNISKYMEERPQDEVHDFFKNLKDPDKILIRSNGLPTYVAKDIGYMMWKHGLLSDMKYRFFTKQPNGEDLWTSDMGKGEEKDIFGHADHVINVIGSEQIYSQQVVHLALKICGFPEAFASSHHMAYALVTLKDGKMSGRKGLVESSYEILDTAQEKAKEILKENHPEYSEDELNSKSEKISSSSVRYALLSQTPSREIVFEWSKILRLDGDSAPYLLYSYVRSLKILERMNILREIDQANFTSSKVQQLEEKVLLIQLGNFQNHLKKGCESYDPTEVTSYAIRLATTFNKFYEKCSIIRAESEEIQKNRLEIVKATIQVLENVFKTLGIKLVDEL
ncbi:MAG: arginine--tRNA ligase [Candidatus Kariarchaeaceae archaeon]